MKRFSITIALIACGLFFAGVVLAQPNLCTQESVVGTYAMGYQGTVLMTPPGASQPLAVPGAGLGIVSIDYQGAMAFTGIQAIGGNKMQGTMPGTMHVNADCTASIAWAGGSTATALIRDEGKEINSMMLTFPMGGVVIYGDWKRLSRVTNSIIPLQCSPASVIGVYAYTFEGSMMMTLPGTSQVIPAPLGLLGSGSVGYDGKTTMAATASEGGQIIPYTFSGKTVLNTDCTFTMTGNVTSHGATVGQAALWGVVLNGDELWGIGTQDPTGVPVYLGTFKRVSSVPTVSTQ